MSTCSRRYVSKSLRGLSLVSANSAPASAINSTAVTPCARPTHPTQLQPLLFLYPTWSRHAVARQYHTEPDCGPGHDPSKQRRNAESTTSSTFLSTQPPTPASRSQPSDESIAAFSPAPPARFGRTTILHNDLNSLEKKDVAPDGRPFHPTHELRDGKPPLRLYAAHAKHQIKPIVTKGVLSATGQATHVSESHQPPSLARFVRAGKRASRRNNWSRRSRASIKTLSNEYLFRRLRSLFDTELPAVDEVTHLTIPSKTIYDIAGSRGDNMWTIHEGSGCKVIVHQKDDHFCHVQLIGSERSRQLAASHLSSSCISPDVLEWINLMYNSRRVIDVRQVPRPPVWNINTFFRYVKALTSPRPARSAQRHAYMDDLSHNKAVAGILQTIFTRPSTMQFASIAALRLALSFFRAHDELDPQAKLVWASSSGVHADTSCFTEEISRTLACRNYARVVRLLDEMKHASIKPDRRLFAVLLKRTTEPWLQAKIKDFVETRLPVGSPLDQTQWINAILRQELETHLCTQDATSSLHEPNTLRAFLNAMTSRYGPAWLNDKTAQQFFRVCREHRMHATTTSTFLEYVIDANVNLTFPLVEELLKIAAQSSSADDLFDVLSSSTVEPAISHSLGLSQSSIELCFMHAWQHRRYNVCRVLWFYAAVMGRVTRPMQMRVLQSLQTNASLSEDADQRIWDALAGKIVIGVRYMPVLDEARFPLISKYRTGISPLTCLLQYVPNGPERHEQKELCWLLVERDLQAFRLFKPVRFPYLLQLLQTAKDLDNEWLASDIVQKEPVIKLLDSCIEIPLDKRTDSLPTPRDSQDGCNESQFVDDDLEFDHVPQDLISLLPISNPGERRPDAGPSSKLSSSSPSRPRPQVKGRVTRIREVITNREAAKPVMRRLLEQPKTPCDQAGEYIDKIQRTRAVQ